MNDTVGEFLKACEYANVMVVEELLASLATDHNFTVVCTQGALMAARKQQWDTVFALTPNVDVAVEDFVLLRAASHNKQWRCFNELCANLNESGAFVVLQHVSSTLLADDQWQSLKSLMDHMQKETYWRGESMTLLLALKALEHSAFGCLKVLEDNFQIHGRLLVDHMKHYVGLMSLVKQKESQMMTQNLDVFDSWKTKGVLDNAVSATPAMSVRARKI